jgi:phosphoribosyl-ATP pyrophosphohydrolase
MFQDLYAIIEARKNNPLPGSYTASLFSAGETKICKKVVEETVEVLLAVRGEGDQRIIEESADLIYHLFVLLASRDILLTAVEDELRRRRRE